MSYTTIFSDLCEIARQQLHPTATASLWGKNPTPPRAPVKLLDLDVSWYTFFSAHDLTNEAQQQTRTRTRDFVIAARAELTEELRGKITFVLYNGKRYYLAADLRWNEEEPQHLRIICAATGESG